MGRLHYFFAVAIVGLAVLAKLSQGVAFEEAKIVKQIPTTHKVVALTIDDGPHPVMTEELLKVLKEKKIKATFFILGKNAKLYPELLEKIKKDGHEIGSHAYTHQYLNKMLEKECTEELDQTEQVLDKTVGQVCLFRPPGGLYNDIVLAEAKKRGYTTILWSVDPQDWQRPSVEHVVSTVVKEVKPGSIVLLHDGQAHLPTPQAIAQIVDYFQQKGYTFVTVSELLQYEEVKETMRID